MRVLVVNKFGFVRGGLERVMFAEMEMLRAAGHEVELFATAHPDNLPSRFSERFPPYREFGPGGGLDLVAVRNMFSNRDAARAVADVIQRYRPDVVHCLGIHRHLSPSVAFAAKRAGVPVVMTAHDFFLVCPANILLRGGSSPCMPRHCGRRFFGAAVTNRCVQCSTARSTLAAVELTYQRTLRTYERAIDIFVTPSRFAADVLRSGGIPTGRTLVVPNSTALTEESAIVPAEGRSGEFVFAGRLSPEKGIEAAIEAARRSGVRLVVAGDGPLAQQLRAAGGAEFLGQLGAEELAARVRSALAVVVPSLGFENAPMTVLEAMAVATPVIASGSGGIPEQIDDGISGILATPGDVDALAAAMRALADDPVRAAAMGAAGLRAARERFSHERHLEGLLGAYRKAGAA